MAAGSIGPGAAHALPPSDGDLSHGGLPSVRDAGAKGDGRTLDGAAFQDALNRFDTVWVPRGEYLIDRPIVLPSYRALIFAAEAVLCPGRDDMVVIATGDVCYSSRLMAPRVHARGRHNVTAFDLRGFRHRAEIGHCDIKDCAQGIVLRELCWDTVIHMPWIRQTRSPIIIADGSNAVDIVHPGIDGCDTGIEMRTGPAHTTSSVRVWGGYIQNGQHGIVDRGCFGTVVDGTYFEGLAQADILLAGSVRASLSRTQHFGDGGDAAIRMVGADGTTVFDPLMTSGARRTGLYDIDASSRNVTRFDAATAAGINQPQGNTGSASRLIVETGGAFAPGLEAAGVPVAYRRQRGRWRRAGAQLTVAIDLGWSGVPDGTPLVVTGLPPQALSPEARSVAMAPALVGGAGTGQAFARLDPTGALRLVTVEGGTERPMVAAGQGWVTLTMTCLD